jgi:integrase
MNRLHCAYMPRLTKIVVEKCRPPTHGQVFVRDSEITSLALRVTTRGSKSFVYEGRIRGRMRRMTLGGYPALSVHQARQEALKIKGAIAKGEDPSLERKKGREALTFGQLAAVYLERHARQHKKSAHRDEQMIECYLARWRNRSVSDITRDDVVRLHQTLGTDHGHYAANRTVALLRTIFNRAADWGHLNGGNPAERLKLFREEKRDRFLSPDELSRVNEALLQEENPYWRAYFPLSLFLGTRRTELLEARWAKIDLERGTWRIPNTKSGNPHLLPLPTAAVEILRQLPSRGTSEWVFPGNGSSGHLIEPAKAWQRIRARAGVSDVRIHDLRRTLGSWLAGEGYSLPLIGRALNHQNASTTQIYARLQLDPVREALEKNAASMLSFMNQTSGLEETNRN